ncbi:MAG TPA: hypothetical protein VFZ59_18760 [Verrucomicrobiae bacterium]|nr:hypothetical protein [Verrucomicrobiae bacterium]
MKVRWNPDESFFVKSQRTDILATEKGHSLLDIAFFHRPDMADGNFPRAVIKVRPAPSIWNGWQILINDRISFAILSLAILL